MLGEVVVNSCKNDVVLTADVMGTEMHIKTDVFCSGSIILPDRAGRQLNVGGWSLQSTFGVRLYTPSTDLDSHKANDWEEDADILYFQVRFVSRAIRAQTRQDTAHGEIFDFWARMAGYLYRDVRLPNIRSPFNTSLCR